MEYDTTTNYKTIMAIDKRDLRDHTLDTKPDTFRSYPQYRGLWKPQQVLYQPRYQAPQYGVRSGRPSPASHPPSEKPSNTGTSAGSRTGREFIGSGFPLSVVKSHTRRSPHQPRRTSLAMCGKPD